MSPDAHYSLMSIEDITNLPVKNLIHPDGCHLYMWVIDAFLEDAFDIIDKWGFRFVHKITWCKVRFESTGAIIGGNIGIGNYFRGVSEDCLFCVSKGKVLPYKLDEHGQRCQGMTAFYAGPGAHSAKPSKMYEIIEKVSYSPYLEMFARHHRVGWSVWGLEAPEEEDASMKTIKKSRENHILADYREFEEEKHEGDDE